MKLLTPFVRLAAAVAPISSPIFLQAQEPAAEVAEAEVEIEPNEKAARYHKLLLRKPGNPTVFSRFVDAWLDTGNKDELKTWLGQNAANGGVSDWQVLAGLHEYLGEDAEALEAYGNAAELEPENGGLRLARAKLQAKLLSFEAALEDLEAAGKDGELEVEAAKLRGIYLARAGRIEEAVAAWKAVIERFPKDEELREDLIEVEVAEGLYDDAITASAELVEMTKDPYKKALRQLRLGDIQILGNKKDEGLATYEKIMAATAADTWLEREVLAQIERVFQREDDVQGLRDFYQKLREEHPRRISIRKALARQMAASGELDEAVALFLEVLKITPGDIGNREEFIAFLETNEKWKEAREELQELIKQQEGDPLLWERLAQLEEKLEEPEGVKKALAKVLELRRGTPEGLLQVASLYSQAELLEESEKILRDGRATYPDSGEVAEALASFLVQNKKEAEAMEIWTAMAKDADREGLLRVARSLTGHGKSAEAFKLLKGRLGDFEEDPLILAQYCNLAFSDEEALAAMPQGLKLVRLAESPTDLESAIRTAGRLIGKAGKIEKLRRELEGKADAGIAEKCLIAELYADQGDTIKALEFLTAAEEADEGLLARFYRVRFEENRGNFERAIAALRKILELPEGRKTVHQRRLVDLLARSGDLPGALEAVEEWKRMAPGDQAAWMRRADLLSDNGEPDKAVLELRRMIGKFGSEEESRARLAAAHLEANEFRSAQRIFEQLYEEGEDLTRKLKWVGELAQVAQREGMMDELMADFERRKRANPTSVAPLLALAEIHQTLNQYEERRSALLEASRRRPNDINLLHQIADVEERAGEFERAVNLLRDADKRDPSPKSKRKLATLQLKNGELKSALRILRDIPDETNDPRQIESTVITLLRQNEVEMALTHLTERMARHPNDWRLQYLRGFILSVDDQKKEALEVYLALTRVDQPIKGLKPLFDPKVLGRNQYWVQQMKEETNFKGWGKLQYFNSITGYEERQFIDRQNQQYYGGSTNQLVQLPGSAEEARLMAFTKAGHIIRASEDEEMKGALDDVLVEGVEKFDLYRLTLTDPTKMFEAVAPELEKNPDDARLATLWLGGYFSLQQPQNNPNAEDEKDIDIPETSEVLSVLKILGKKNPTMGTQYLSSLVHMEKIEMEAASKFLEELLTDLPSGEERLQLALMGTGMGERRGLPGGEKVDLSVFQNAVVTEALAVEKKPKDFGSLEQALMIALSTGKAEEAVVLANRLSKWLGESGSVATSNRVRYSSSFASFGGSFSQSRRWSSSSQGNGLLRTFPFPPRSVKGVSQQLSSLVMNKLGQSKAGNEANEKTLELLAKLEEGKEKESGKDEDNNKAKIDPLSTLKGHEDKIENPLLQVLLRTALGDDEALPKFVEGLADSRDPDELRLAVGYFSKEEKFAEAYEMVLRLRMLTLPRNERNAVDGALVRLGILLTQEEKKAEGEAKKWDRQAAQRAALRLRKVMRAGNDRAQLMTALTSLGLQEEAEKIANKAVVSTNRSPSSSRNRNRNQVIMDLVKKGQREQAAREAAKVLRSYNRSNSPWEIRELLKNLKNLGLAKLTLEKMDPGETESIPRRLSYASVARQSGEDAIAKPVYHSILKDKPEHLEAQIGLLMTTPEKERNYNDFLKPWMEKGDEEDLSRAMNMLWQNNANSLEQVLAYLRISTALLSQLPPEPKEEQKKKRNLTWANYYVMNVARSNYFDGKSLGAIFGQRNDRSSDKEGTAQRDEAFRAFFATMLKHPQTTRQGFMMMEQAQKNLNYSDEEMLAAAKLSLETWLTSEDAARHTEEIQRSYPGNSGLWVLKNGNSMSSGSELENGTSPLEYLTRHSEGGIESVLTPELLAKLRESQPEKFEMLDLGRQLVTTSPEDAQKKYSEWIAKIDGEEKPKREQKLVELTRYLLSLDPKPAPWLTDLRNRSTKFGSENQSYNPGGPVMAVQKSWLTWLTKTGDPEAAKDYVLEIAITHLGPVEKWPILAELGENRRPQEYRQKVYQLQNTFRQLAVAEGGFSAIANVVMMHGLEKIEDSFAISQLSYQALGNRYQADDILKWLEDNQILKSPKEGSLDPGLALTRITIIQQLRQNGTDQMKEMTKRLKELKDADPLFRPIAISHYDGGEDHKEAVRKALEERADLVTGMIEVNRDATTIFLRRWYPELNSEKAGPKMKTILKSLQEDRLAAMNEEAERWLSGDFILDADDYQGRQTWTKVIRIAHTDPKKAGQIAAAVLQQVKDDPNLNRSNSSTNGIRIAQLDMWAGELFEKIAEMSGQDSLANSVKVADALIASEIAEEISSFGQGQYNNSTYDLRNAARRVLDATKSPEGFAGGNLAVIFEGLCEKLTPSEQATFVSLYFNAFLEHWYTEFENLERHVKFANETLRPKSPLLAEAYLTIVQTKGRRKIKEEQEKKLQIATLASFAELLELLKVKPVQATGWVSCLNRNGGGSSLLNSPALWQWTAGHLANLNNGKRTIYFTGVLELFSLLDRAEFEEKKEVTEEFLKIADTKLVTPELILSMRNSSNAPWLQSYVRLALIAENEELAKRIVLQNATTFRGNLPIILALVESKLIKSANRLVAAPTQAYQPASSPNYDEKFEESLKPLFEQIPERDHFRLRVLTAALPDKPTPKKDGEKVSDEPTARSLRLQELARQYSENIPRESGPRWQILATLVTEPDTIGILAPELKKEAEKMNLVAAVTLRHEGNSGIDGNNLIKLIETWLINEIEVDRLDPFLTTLEELQVAAKGDNSYYYRETLTRLANQVGSRFLVKATASEEVAKSLLDPMTKLTEVLKVGNIGDYEKEPVFIMELFLHTLAGTSEKWYEKATATMKEGDKEVPKNIQLDNIARGEWRYGLGNARHGTPLGSAKSLPTRKKMVEALLRDPHFFKYNKKGNSFLRRITSQGLLAADDLKEVISRIPEDNPFFTELLIHKAVLTMNSTGEYEQARPILLQALKVAEDQGKPDLKHVINAYDATLLRQSGKPGMAVALAGNVDLEKLSADDQKWFKRDLEKWKKEAEMKMVKDAANAKQSADEKPAGEKPEADAEAGDAEQVPKPKEKAPEPTIEIK